MSHKEEDLQHETKKKQKKQKKLDDVALKEVTIEVDDIDSISEPVGGGGQAPPLFFKSKAFKMIGCIIGIICTFVVYGVLQERIMTQAYTPHEGLNLFKQVISHDANHMSGDSQDEEGGGGEEEEGRRFTNVPFLVLNNRIVTMTMAVLLSLVRGHVIAPVAPLHKYFVIASTNTVATFCQYQALMYISFPSATLVKCAKSVPVLILGWLVAGTRFTAQQVLSSISIAVGCAFFLLSGDISSGNSAKEDSFYGIALSVIYLCLDGFTSNFQQRLFREIPMPTLNQLLYVNLWSALILFTELCITGGLFSGIAFVQRYPLFMVHSFLLALCSMLGQYLIYTTVREFGSLFFALLMTTRQVVSIVVSCLIFLHPLALTQCVAVGLVFSTLYISHILPALKKDAPQQRSLRGSSSSTSPGRRRVREGPDKV